MTSRSGKGVGEKGDTEASPLSKKQRGRLKKLRKRATTVSVQHVVEQSGIATANEWNEWIELNASGGDGNVVVGPSLHFRKQSHQSVRGEGWHHRDVLFHLTSSPMTPIAALPTIWKIHNLASLQSIAVIELHSENDYDFFARVPLLRGLQAGTHPSHFSLSIETEWFRGPKPRSISDVCMYTKPPHETRKKRKAQPPDSTVASTTKDLVLEIRKLVATESQRSKHGYPRCLSLEAKPNRSGNDDESLMTMVAPIELPTLEESRRIVTRHCVKVLQEDAEFVKLPPPSSSCKAKSRIFAVDCEMVETHKDNAALARVTLVELVDSRQAKIVLDELVKPEDTILNYKTEFSGITAKMLGPVTTRLVQIQAVLVQLLHSDDVLVGHSLENDLCALHLVHEQVVDTALLFQSKDGRGRKYSLKHLSAKLLKRYIQQDTGHCSHEDATAALDLAVQRAIQGPSFCIPDPNQDRIHLLESMDRNKRTNNREPIVCIGPDDWLRTHVTSATTSANALACDGLGHPNSKAVSSYLASNSRRHAKLVWACFHINQKEDESSLQKWLGNVLQTMSAGTLVLIAFQPKLCSTLPRFQQRKARQNPKASLGWSDKEEADYLQHVDRCRVGRAIWVGAKVSGPGNAAREAATD